MFRLTVEDVLTDGIELLPDSAFVIDACFHFICKGRDLVINDCFDVFERAVKSADKLKSQIHKII